jgi:S1-C subfamily serine protease
MSLHMTGLKQAIRRAGLLLPFLLLSGTARSDDFPPRALKAARDSTVHVFGSGRSKGGGVVVDRAGTVLTAAHVLDVTNCVILLQYPSGQRVGGKAVAVDVQADLVLIEPSGRVTNAVPAEFARRDAREGEEIVAVGPALWEPMVSTFGRVASIEPHYQDFSTLGYVVRTRFVNAMTPKLFSGSGWFTADGRLAGIQNGYLNNHEGGISGLAMVACLDDMRRIVETRKDASTPGIGGSIWELWTADPAHIAGFPPGIEGLIVTRIAPDGALARARIPQLSLILSINGTPTHSRRDFYNALRNVGPGVEIRLKVRKLKSGEESEMPLKADALEPAWRAQYFPRSQTAAPAPR